MPLDLSPQMVGLIVLGGLALLIALAVVCSGRAEELKAGIDIVLADKPAERETPVEDFFAPISETYPETAGELQLELSDAEVDDRFAAMVAAENARAAFPRRWPYSPKHRRSQEGPS
jgi:beta-glucosidase-like glycosyl hydrolase